MKKFNKYLKVILCFMAFAVCGFVFAFSPSLAVFSALDYSYNNYELAIKALQIPSEFDAQTDGDLEIPLLSTVLDGGVYKYTIRVIGTTTHEYYIRTDNQDNLSQAEKDSNTAQADYFELNGNKLKIKARNNGKLNVVYIVEKDGQKFYTNTYTINVSNVSYGLDFTTRSGDKEGLKNLIPSKWGKNTKLYLPTATARLVDEDGIFLTDEEGKVKAGTDLSFETDVIVRNGDGVEQVANATGSAFKSDSNGYYILSAEADTYTVEYKFNNSENVPSKTFKVEIASDFTAPTELNFSISKINNLYLGEEVTLPSEFTVSDENNTDVEYNVTSIVIQKVKNSDSDKDIKLELKNNNFTFKFDFANFTNATSYDDLIGNYDITYFVSGAYENQTGKDSRRVEGITVKGDPKAYLSYDYEVSDNAGVKSVNGDVNKDAQKELKAKYGKKEIYVPAIYAEDAVSDYNDFTFIRYLVDTTNKNNIYYIDNLKYNESTKALEAVAEGDIHYNYSADANIGKVNKSVQFKFKNDVTNYAGTYYLEYRAISNKLKVGSSEREGYVYSSGSTMYSIQVLETDFVVDTDKSVPTITLNAPVSVKSNKTYEAKIDATDATNSSRLTSKVFIYTADKDLDLADVESAISTAKGGDLNIIGSTNVLATQAFIDEMVSAGYTGFEILEETEFNTFTFDVPVETNVRLAAVTINAYGKVGIASKKLNVKITNETVNAAPDYEIVAEDATNLEQGLIYLGEDNIGSDDMFDTIAELTEVEQTAKIKLPTVKFTDAVDKALDLDVRYYIKNSDGSYSADSEEVGVDYLYTNAQYSVKNGTIDGGIIEANTPGDYFVIYSATDDAGNTSVVYLTFKVLDSSKPSLIVNPTFDKERGNVTVSGNTISAEAGAEISFESLLKDAQGEDIAEPIIEFVVDGLGYKPGEVDGSYIFNKAGEFTVVVKGSYTNDSGTVKDADNKIFYISIKEPEIKFNSKISVQEYGKVGEVIYLNALTANYGATDNVIQVKPVVKTQSGSIVDLEKELVNGFEKWKFTADTKGTYTVTYTASYLGKSGPTETFKIKVGDSVAPTFEMENESALKQDIIYKGKDIEYKLNVNKTDKTFVIEVISGGKTVYSYDTKLKVYDKDNASTDKTEINWTNLSYELSSDTSSSIETGEKSGDSIQYIIKGTGKFTLKLTVKDDYDNSSEKVINFNVVSEGESTSKNDTVIGVVLIVLSLIVLAGVILFFAFTGKKGSSTKTKKAKKSNKKVNKTSNEKVEETKVEETEVKDEVVENDNVEPEEKADESIVVEETEQSQTEETESQEESQTEEVEDTQKVEDSEESKTVEENSDAEEAKESSNDDSEENK